MRPALTETQAIVAMSDQLADATRSATAMRLRIAELEAENEAMRSAFAAIMRRGVSTTGDITADEVAAIEAVLGKAE